MFRFARSASLYAIAASTLAIGAPSIAFAQDAALGANPPEDAAKTAPGDEIVVTGVLQKTRKVDTTFTIDTIDQNEIQRLAPISTADLLNNIPGFFAEGSTAGERSNNVTVRGLPSSGYRYAPQLVDGMPVFQDSDVPFSNSDVFFTDDLMTDRIEAIKGGPGGVLYSNGLGAVVNHITKTGGDDFAGGYKLEVANYGFVRNDLFVSGPLGSGLHFALGGFYRTSDGLRNVGYTADRGGQVRGNLTYKSDDGKTNIGFYATLLNDRTAIYNNLPIEVPGFSAPGTAAHPIYINPNSITPIGINFQNGSLLSPTNRYVTQVSPSGQQSIADLADGEHPNFTTLAGKFSKELDSGWRFDVDVNYVSGTNGFDALFAGNDAARASAFSNDRWVNDVLQPAFDANYQLSTGTPNNSSYYNRYVLSNAFNPLSATQFQNQYFNVLNCINQAPGCQNFSTFPQLRQQFGQQQSIGNATGVGAFYQGSGQAVAGTTPLSFEIPWIVQSKLQSATENLKIQKDFDLFGSHHLTFGGYHSTDSDVYNFQAALTVSTLESTPQLVNLYTVNAAGQKQVPLSINGSYLPGFYGNAVNGSAEGYAAYVEDHWESPDNRLKVDAGFRWETEKMNVLFQNRQCCALPPGALPLVPGQQSNPTSNIALAQLQFLGPSQSLNQRYYGNGWSIGANYSIRKSLAIYALASRSFRLPSLNDGISFAQSSPLADPTEHITQYEGGVRFSSRFFDASLVGFYNKFTPRTLINTYSDISTPGCISGTNLAACPLINQPFSYGTTNVGTEIEATVRPPFIPGFDLRANLILQNPKVNGSIYTINNLVNNIQVLSTVSQDGRREGRQAAATIFLHARWDMKPLTQLPVKLFADFEHRSSRYSNSQDLNVTVYPSYYILNMGALLDVTKRLSIQAHVANLTNQLSFTEGDPLFFDLKAPDGIGNRGVARPLFGRTERLTVNYRF